LTSYESLNKSKSDEAIAKSIKHLKLRSNLKKEINIKKNMLTVLALTFCLAIIFFNIPSLANSDQSADVDKYIQMLGSTSLKTRLDAAKFITRSGITDSKLYIIINEKLLTELNTKGRNRDHIDEMSWMCKTLASSGMAEYKQTLREIIENSSNMKLQKYAKQSLGKL
jgi:hypothetical protein